MADIALPQSSLAVHALIGLALYTTRKLQYWLQFLFLHPQNLLTQTLQQFQGNHKLFHNFLPC